LPPDRGFLDYRPPFLGAGFHKRAERLRRLLVARKNLYSELDEPRSHRWIGQCLHDRRIEFADNVVWRAPRREKPEPGRVGSPGRPISTKVGISGANRTPSTVSKSAMASDTTGWEIARSSPAFTMLPHCAGIVTYSIKLYA